MLCILVCKEPVIDKDLIRDPFVKEMSLDVAVMLQCTFTSAGGQISK